MKAISIIFGLLIGFTSPSIIAGEPVSQPEQEKFRFFINADPQMGPEKTERKGLQILNELLENFVAEVNLENKKEPIDFVVYNGDLVWDPYQDAFDNFTRIVSKQQVPVKLVHGNHDGYNDDPKFFQAQKKLSGYEKLNYSFDYGNWHFVVIGAQEKYLQESQKQQQLEWIRNELAAHKDKKVMMFMHYHIMPVGLSQMEYYSYWPMAFKHQILDEITKHGNVKYVFNGHVHVGVKASMKSSLAYKGTRFVNSPTPVMARPFGEEFAEFENDPEDRYFRRGFYMEVKVDGDEVEMIGHKIDHDFEVKYPKKFKEFKPVMDKRFYQPEAEMKPNKKLKNPSFNKGFKGWRKSYRYKKDKDPAFRNTVKNGSNILRLDAPWGSWSFDEYMETYQVVELNLSENNILNYHLSKPKFMKKGGGGYIRLNFFNHRNEINKMLLIHWGEKEERVKLMHQSWFYHANGNRFKQGEFEEMINNNDLFSIGVDFDNRPEHHLSINLNDFLKHMNNSVAKENVKVTLSHGVWCRVTMKGAKLFSELTVHDVRLTHEQTEKNDSFLMLNNHIIDTNYSDNKNPYFTFKK